MHKVKTIYSPFPALFAMVLLLWLSSCRPVVVDPPLPFGPVPTMGQIQWHDLEYYGFIHFGLNTFTGQEWGYGNVPAHRFNPTGFNADEMVALFREAGMKGLILTCKHHDGFCLWPTEFTEYSVKNSPWRNGKGDVVREISEACARHGLKFGVYLSPWDRNHAGYGKADYIRYYRDQLRELLTNYGPVFEVWFDGANGGTGWYGGANEARQINRSTYYDWENTWKRVRELQPEAVIFSDVGPDVRWVGNEQGVAGDPCWVTYTPRTEDNTQPAPGQTDYQRGLEGDRNGEWWMPAECDVSIRPGWFYHADEDRQVKNPEELMELYFQSVGRGASLLLNVPPDSMGRISPGDAAALTGFRHLRNALFATNLASRAKVTATNTRGRSDKYLPANLIDDRQETYWTCDDSELNPEVILEFRERIVFNVLSVREYLPLGQRINSWALDVWIEDEWVTLWQGTSIGAHRLARAKPVNTAKVRFRVVDAPVCPALSELGLYFYPDFHNE